MSPYKDYTSSAILADKFCGPSLRCEPALTVAIDAMKRGPCSRWHAEQTARKWQRIEASLWPELYMASKNDRRPNQRQAAIAKITPEYILATVRTKKFREAE